MGTNQVQNLARKSPQILRFENNSLVQCSAVLVLQGGSIAPKALLGGPTPKASGRGHLPVKTEAVALMITYNFVLSNSINPSLHFVPSPSPSVQTGSVSTHKIL